MADIFTNTTFYSDVDPNTGYRTPISLNYENPDVPDVPDEVVENPDPGGPGGGTGGGGDIGNIDGSGTSTTGTAPGLTRKTHDQDIFVVSSGTMTVTYVADGDCTILPKRPRADMTVSYTDNGREMTITWNVPANERGDSTYIGAEAWVYGSNAAEEAVTSIWDRLHINKTAGDIKVIGAGTSYPIIQTGIERTDIAAGDTIVINDGTYTDFYDVINFGYWGGETGGVANTTTPNGVSDGVTTVNVIGDDGVTVTGTEDIISISKYTAVMAATPLGVVLDRGYRNRGCRFYGDYRPTFQGGGRNLHGVKVKGVALRRWLDAFSIEHADDCHFEFCSAVSDINPEDYEAATNRTWGANYESSWNNGGSFSMTSARNCSFNTTHSISNARFGYIFGSQTLAGTRGSKHSSVMKSMHTTACVYPYSNIRVQSYTWYGARSIDTTNCMSIDSAFFEAGYRDRYKPSTFEQNTVSTVEHFSFISTNNLGDDIYSEGLISLNTTSGGYRSKANSSMIQSTVKNSVFWDKKGLISFRPMVEAQSTDFLNITVGKNATVGIGVSSCIRDGADYNGVYENVLMLSGPWNYSYSSTDTSISGSPQSGDLNFGIIPPENSNPAYMAGVTDVTLIQAQNAKTSGAHYISRTNPGSTLNSQNVGCPDVFPAVGTGGNLKLDADRTRYDGTGGNQYVSWLSEIPWIEFRRERQSYDCLANGQTFTGNVGIGKTGVNPTDYINRFGTTPLAPLNTPFIADIYGKALGSGAVNIWWRPVCPAYRASITGYHLYIDGVKVTPAGSQLSKESHSFSFTSVNTGARNFQIVVVDPVNGNSGLSRPLSITVT